MTMNDNNTTYKPNDSLNRVFIIGNGFDIGLGLKTSYKDYYADSSTWPKIVPNRYDSLMRYLMDAKSNIRTWFDLEKAMSNYVHRNGNSIAGKDLLSDKNAYDAIKKGLIEYLKKQEDSFSGTMCPPLERLISFYNQEGNNRVYSFNYTDPNKFLKKCGVDKHISITHVHGSLANNNIILGVGDSNEILSDYGFMYKMADTNFRGCNLLWDLDTADEVFFYGHSLGDNDHDYFKSFFQESTEIKPTHSNRKKKIVFYTADEQSEIDLKMQLRELTDRKVQKLIQVCRVEVIHCCKDLTK